MSKKSVLVLEAHRNCYDLDQLGDTMTIGQLIDLLQNYDPDTIICTSHDNGYTFGEIERWDFEEKTFEIDDEDEDEEEDEEEDEDEEE